MLQADGETLRSVVRFSFKSAKTENRSWRSIYMRHSLDAVVLETLEPVDSDDEDEPDHVEQDPSL